MLGEPRLSHAARQQYVVGTVRKYEEKAQTALDRPGHLHPSMEIWREVSRLNAEFDKFMRTYGGTWHFEDIDTDPLALIEERMALQAKASAEGRALPPYARKTPKTEINATLNKAFPGLSEVRDTDDLMKTINERLSTYQVSQLDGVINPDIYPDMYQEQVKKWNAIAERHLQRVATTVSSCTASILDAVCPLNGDTGLMPGELRELLASSFKRSEALAHERCRSQCEMETKCTRLQSTGSRFGDEILNWRRFRFFEAFSNSYTGPDSNLALCFNSIHPSLKKNMVIDVHDVLKVYYKIALDAFIRNINMHVIQSFVTAKDGPVWGLNTNRILGLSEEEMRIVGGENENTARRRKELEHDIEKLRGALAIVDRATRQTANLERE
uniref:WGS project CBMI000000000 data, contig CS3069_c003611 n=1 Tax=Fusarium clavum TaxID=2594811 RepID=A0A090ME30_9HYPO|nr:unnamed protein product [Fusarium clavum]